MFIHGAIIPAISVELIAGIIPIIAHVLAAIGAFCGAFCGGLISSIAGMIGAPPGGIGGGVCSLIAGYIIAVIPAFITQQIVSCLLNPCTLFIDTVVLDPLKTLDYALDRTWDNKYQACTAHYSALCDTCCCLCYSAAGHSIGNSIGKVSQRRILEIETLISSACFISMCFPIFTI